MLRKANYTVIMMFLVILLIYSLVSVKADCERDAEIVCYWGSWSIYRQEDGFFTTEHISTDICTTIVYAFAGLDLTLNIASLNPDGDITKTGFKNFTQLKEKNPCLTTMLAIGGWNEGSRKYSVLAGSESMRTKFADNVLAFLVYYDFDGIDIDWEYPTTRGGIEDDGKNLILLLKELKNRLSPYKLKLSIAVASDESLINKGYLVSDLSKIVDSVNLMAYDFISSTSEVTGLAAPLSEVKESVSTWLKAGLPSRKLILGIPAYAKNFVLKDRDKNGIGAPVKSIGNPGLYTKEDGLLAYFEVLQILNDWSDMLYDETLDGTKYAYYDDEWFTYDDVTTVKSKTEYAMDTKLGGIMVWSIELDDFGGTYGDKYPLLNSIKNTIAEYSKKHAKASR